VSGVAESPSFKKLIENKLGLTAFGIGNLRNVEWGKKYLWAVRFTDPKPPKPFDTFFPASDVTIPEATLNSYNFEQGQSSFRVPQRSEISEISLTFYDDNIGTLQTWMKNWINIDILNQGKFVSCLKDSHPVSGKLNPYNYNRVYPTRTLELTKLDESLSPIEGGLKVYTVYPEGTLEWSGSSGSEAQSYTVTFTIVGENNPDTAKHKPDFIKDAASKGAQLLGRFF